MKPPGEEMSESEKGLRKKRKKEVSLSVSDSEGLRGLFTRTSLLPGVNGVPGGTFSIQDSDEGERENLLKKDELEEEEEEEVHKSEKDLEAEKESKEARMFRIQSIGSSEMSASVAVPHPVIKVTVEDEDQEEERDKEGDKKMAERREQELAGASLPPIIPRPDALDIPSNRRRRGKSADVYPGYGAMEGSINVKRRSPSHSPSHSPASSPAPGRRRMRKTISGKWWCYVDSVCAIAMRVF